MEAFDYDRKAEKPWTKLTPQDKVMELLWSVFAVYSPGSNFIELVKAQQVA